MQFNYDYKSLTEELLFKRYCEGDIKAFDALLERLQGLAYSMILRYVKNVSLADEIFQEVFFKVCKNKDQFREAVSFKSWLVTICRNTCIDYTRKQSREFKTTSLDGGMEDEGRSLAEQIAADAPSPLEEVSFKIEDAHVAELLDNLPAEQRDTFYQKVVMEMTFEEIGAAMGCSANTAKSRYRYALVALRSLVKRKRLLSKAAS
jgi:RNA polymerase sigma-70 factor (ECF subfamily)